MSGPHVAVEKRQHQNADVAAVHVGIRHADDAVIAQLLDIKIVAHAAAERRNHRLDFVVGQHAVKARLFDVQNLAAQRQNRLEVAVAAHLRAAACGIALDEEDFALAGVALGAVRQFARQARAFQHRLAAGQVARLARRLARAGSGQTAIQNQLGDLRVLFQIIAQLLAHQRIDDGAHLAVAQLGFGLALKLRIFQLDGDDRRPDPRAYPRRRDSRR